MILNILVKYMNKNKLEKIAIVIFFIIMIFVGLYIKTAQENKRVNELHNNQISYEISDIPEYNGNIYVLINNNIPNFTDEDMNREEHYSDLEDGIVRNGYNKN